MTMVTVARGLLLCGLTLLPWGSLLSQAPAAKPQASTPKAASSSINLSFGPTASNPEGKAAADQLLQALGGPAQVNAVKSLHQTVAALRQGQRIALEQSIVYPDKQAQKMTLSQKKMLLVVTPSDAFMVVGTQPQNLPPDQRFAMDATLKHDFINVLQHINDPKYIFVATGHEKVGGVDATVVDVQADGVPTRWWIASDGKLLQERYSDMTQEGNIQIMTYADWKNFDGLVYPTKYEMFSETGKPQLSMTLTAMQVNPAINPKLFERP